MRVRKNYLWVVVALIVIVGGIVTALLLRKQAAPDAVRLLPNSDAVLYINLEPIRLLTDLGKNPPKERDPQYEDFVRQTGFEFERDRPAFVGLPVQPIEGSRDALVDARGIRGDRCGVAQGRGRQEPGRHRMIS